MAKVTSMKEIVAHNLHFIRKTFRKNQDEMATLLSVSRPSYSNYEGARQDIPLFAILRLTKLTGLTVEALTSEVATDQVKILQHFAEAMATE